MTYSTIMVERTGAAEWLTLNRPKRLNAIDPVMTDELLDYFGRQTIDSDVRAIVLRGAGRAFCAGLDLATTAIATDFDVRSALAGQRRIAEIVMRMRRCPQPIVALVHGPACGGGLGIALAADVRLAGASMRMNAAFIRIGFSACDIGVSYFLPRLVGASIAAELMLTGDFIHADRALAIGLVSRVVPDEELDQAALELVDNMLSTSPVGLTLTKECLRMAIDAPSLESAIAMEDRNQMLCAASPAVGEGIAAFLQKRSPVYASRAALPIPIDRS